MTDPLSQLPWRGPGEDRPDLPLPPGKMPLRNKGILRKQWRYVAAFAEPFSVCAARVQVGPLRQTFWAVVDRERGEIHENTKLRLPGSRGEVYRQRPGGGPAPNLGREKDSGLVDEIRAGDVRVRLEVGEGNWAESICPAGDTYVWTRKRCDVPIRCRVQVGDREWEADARGVEDESAGYHPRHTVWSWSAGVGRTRDGRSVGWNLVEGVNDPTERSERSIWLDGEPSEPGPVRFEDLDAIAFDDGSRLEFSPEAERRAAQRRPLISYEYVQPFGTFIGTLPGGIELESGLGVMEFHDAHW